jgi:hypothetical protein
MVVDLLSGQLLPWEEMARPVARLAGPLTGFFWPYFDSWLSKRAGALDAASGYYFLGRRGPYDWALSDRELVGGYRGIHR